MMFCNSRLEWTIYKSENLFIIKSSFAKHFENRYLKIANYVQLIDHLANIGWNWILKYQKVVRWKWKVESSSRLHILAINFDFDSSKIHWKDFTKFNKNKLDVILIMINYPKSVFEVFFRSAQLDNASSRKCIDHHPTKLRSIKTHETNFFSWNANFAFNLDLDKFHGSA